MKMQCKSEQFEFNVANCTIHNVDKILDCKQDTECDDKFLLSLNGSRNSEEDKPLREGFLTLSTETGPPSDVNTQFNVLDDKARIKEMLHPEMNDEFERSECIVEAAELHLGVLDHGIEKEELVLSEEKIELHSVSPLCDLTLNESMNCEVKTRKTSKQLRSRQNAESEVYHKGRKNKRVSWKRGHSLSGNKCTVKRRSHRKGKGPFICTECGKKCRDNYDLSSHSSVHTGAKTFSCEFCGKSYTTKRRLLEHRRKFCPDTLFMCENCGKSFLERLPLLNHVKNQCVDQLFSCGRCGKSCSDKSKLLDHIKSKCVDQQFLCDHCGKSFSDKSTIAGHVKLHGDRPFKCEYCSQCFYRKTHLARHEKLHNGIKPFSCDICKKLFSRKSHVLWHMAVHTQERTFRCEHCPRSFTQKSFLVQHLEMHLVSCCTHDYKESGCENCRASAKDKIKFHCAHCKKSFSSKIGLVDHIVIHTGPPEFECGHCGKLYYGKRSLRLHIKTHKQVRRFLCHYCGKSYVFKAELNNHMSVRHGDADDLSGKKLL